MPVVRDKGQPVNVLILTNIGRLSRPVLSTKKTLGMHLSLMVWPVLMASIRWLMIWMKKGRQWMIAGYTPVDSKTLHNTAKPVQRGVFHLIVIARSRAIFPQAANEFTTSLGNGFMNRQVSTPLRASGGYAARMKRLRAVVAGYVINRHRRAAHHAYPYLLAIYALAVVQSVDGRFYVRKFCMIFR